MIYVYKNIFKKFYANKAWCWPEYVSVQVAE